MSKNTVYNGVGAKRLDLDGASDKSGKNMEYLLIAALSVIIVASLGLTIYFSLFSGRPTHRAAEQWFKCQKCGKEFSIKPEDIPLDTMGIMMVGPGALRLDCPACGAKKSAYQMVRCPNPDCQKYYVPESSKDPEAMLQGKEFKDICPYCKTDRIQWYREHRKKRKKK
ncbi:MAG: hypothetical protein SVT52_08905 [Planctomycetota bacterium]|nr:hypothetical protein [Planctomycetota bacterium]